MEYQFSFHPYYIFLSLLRVKIHMHCQSMSISLQPLTVFPSSYLIFLFIIINNCMNKKSMGKLVKKQTYQQSSENFKNDINSKFSELNDYCNYLEVKYETVDSPC